MAADIELKTVVIPGTTRKLAHGSISIAGNEWLQIRHGTLSSPVVDLQEKCPAGKKWDGTIEIFLTESDE